MNPTVKKIITALVIIVLLIVAGYAAYRIYLWAITDATQRIKQGVSQGVSQGIGEGIGGAINPLSWPGKLIPGK